MISLRYRSELLHWKNRILSFVLLLAGAVTATAACNESITSGDYTGTVGVAVTYQIVATGNPRSFGAANLPPGLTVNTSTGVISGAPTTAGTYSVTLQATYQGSCGTISRAVTFTINAPAFVGFRLPDFQMSAGSTNNPRLMLQVGANGTGTTGNRFNATLEVDASGNGTAWIPYNHFVSINDATSWITDAPLPVRDSGALDGTPRAFSTAQLTESPPGVYVKADPRSTRFGIFQMDTNPSSNPSDARTSRIMRSIWPTNDSTVANGYGGAVGTTFPGPVEHAPVRFSSAEYYPATFSINGPPDSRDTSTTMYADNDGVTRPADAIYPDPTASTTGTGSWTPYYTASAANRPIILNRPFRNVAELGYAFRDLPWKSLDLFSDKSADAGLLDVFSINDGGPTPTPSVSSTPTSVGVVAGRVNLNTRQTPVLQSILAGAIWDEINSAIVNNTGTPTEQIAPTIATNITDASSVTPFQNKAEMITRAGLATQLLPLPTTSQDNQTVKARREVVPRAISSVSQTRVWNLLIDVVAQSGRYKPNANNLQNDFVVEGEQHYWVHVAIDRFTGEVIDKQIEVVNE